ncbi:hypothetical protein E1218_09080 [Kribbella turkmenica]|uniref:Uncharacterized protein n=1 Tax=Kribbella turkmenica TaxID=2530375 RepID=A0A4R4XB17_9ACTN|nr:hypothetical protein [Kribbella turkmenica]TDD27811.1 hypothetical protein E1218_09080 [Kribbella turkmenica]
MHSTFRRAGPLACSGAVVFGGPALRTAWMATDETAWLDADSRLFYREPALTGYSTYGGRGAHSLVVAPS